MKRILSLFSGCGGLDLGFEGGFFVHKKSVKSSSEKLWIRLPYNNFKIIFANDIMPQAQKVWCENFEGTYVLKSIVELLDERYKFPEADIVIGGFPCQDFSLAGKRKGLKSDRGILYQSMIKVIQQVQPKVFVAENVAGLLSMSGSLDTMLNDFKKLNYQVYHFLLSAEDFGVPQARKRLFFIGFHKGIKHIPPIEKACPKPNLQKAVTLADIFADLKEPEESKDIEQQSFSRAKYYGKNRQGNNEINLSMVGPTIRAEHHGNIEFRRLKKEHGGKIIHEIEKGMNERRLTVRECARIQTFPDDFHLMRDKCNQPLLSSSSAYRVIGNAVPPLLAYHIAHRIDKLWEEIV